MNRQFRRFLLVAVLVALILGTAPAVWAQAGGAPPPPGSGAILVPILLLLILVMCIGFTYAEGMWSNAVRLVNVVISALVATNFWEPAARFCDDSLSSSFSFFWDFVCLWGIFAISMLILRLATNSLSQVKVRFLKIADQIGSGAFAFLIGWVMVCFTTMSLHTAPLSRYFLFGGFVPEESKVLGMSPDFQWLSFFEQASGGAFSWSEPTVFDPGHKFVSNYAMRRDLVEKQRTDKKSFRLDGEYGSAVPSR